MLYMLICSALSLTFISMMLKSVLYGVNGEREMQLKEARKVFAVMPLVIILNLPFGLSIFFANTPYSVATLQTISLLVQWAGVIASLLTSVLFWSLSEKGKKFWFTGCAILSLVLCFIFFDSALFNSGETGQANGLFIKSVATDVDCEKGVVVFKYNKEGETEWRCTSDLAMMQESNKLFIPWPSYKSGHSSQLTKAIRELQDKFKDKK